MSGHSIYRITGVVLIAWSAFLIGLTISLVGEQEGWGAVIIFLFGFGASAGIVYLSVDMIEKIARGKNE